MSNSADVGEKGGKQTLFITVEGEAGTLTANVDPSATIASALEVLGRQHSRNDLVEFLVSLEDADEHTATTVVVLELLGGKQRGRVHLHRCHRVKTSIVYNGRTLTHEFSPASTVHRVWQWAVGSHGFNVEHDAHDLVMQVSGTTEPLPPNLHIGSLVRERRCELALELVPKDRPQG